MAPLRIETGRYENKNVNERVCFICHDQIEDEKHVLLDCPYMEICVKVYYRKITKYHTVGTVPIEK